MDRVSILLEYFIKAGKIKYNSTTKELAIGNWLKYNNSTSPKVKSCIDKEFGYCKDSVLIEYVKSMDTLSQEEQEQEEEKEEYLLPKILFNYKKCSDIEFVQELSKFKDLYNKKTLNAFYIYWSDKNEKGKMKLAMQDTFEINKRLVTWQNNEIKFGKSETIDPRNPKNLPVE
jgi:hypothetical protein